MREQLEVRLEVLKQEFETGQARYQEIEAQQARLRETLLRISGAIQVLEELMAGSGPGAQNPDRSAEPQVASQPGRDGQQ